MKDDYVLITGASGGLGEAFAEIFSKNGYNTILFSRNENKLLEISKRLKSEYKTNSIYYTCDLLVLDDVKRCIDEIVKSDIRVSMLINNAGISNFGTFKGSSFTDELEIVNLNIISLMYITKLLLPELSKCNESRIMNVASLVGTYPLPYQAVYAAAKSFVISFSSAIAAELDDDNIQVSVLLPGNIKTNFIKRSGLSRLYSKIKIEEMTAIEVAAEAYKQFMKGTKRIYPSSKLKRIANFIRFRNPDKIANMQYKRRKKILVNSFL